MFMADETKLALNLEALKETRFAYRDEEVSQIVLSMSNNVNTYVYGSVGTGKTTAVKHAIGKFNDAKSKAIYVNCSICETEYAVLREIIDQINESFVQKIFIETRSNYDLVRRIKKEKERLPGLKVVVLDHIDALEEAKIVDGLLDIGFAVFLVGDQPKALHRLSALSQSYFANVIQFKDYTSEQTTKILQSKMRHMVGEGFYKERLVMQAAVLCNGNLGYGENLLLASVLKAVSLKKGCVDESDIPHIEKDEELSPDEKAIMEVMKEQHSVQGGQLYRLYCERTRFAKAERTFRNYMRSLSERNLVKAIGTNKGRVYELVE